MNDERHLDYVVDPSLRLCAETLLELADSRIHQRRGMEQHVLMAAFHIVTAEDRERENVKRQKRTGRVELNAGSQSFGATSV